MSVLEAAVQARGPDPSLSDFAEAFTFNGSAFRCPRRVAALVPRS
jgi:hypothetical protein